MVEWFSMSFKVLITSKSLCCRDILMLSISLIINTTSFLIKKSVFIAKTHTQSHFNSLIHIAYKHWYDWTMMAQKPCLWNGESVYSHWPAVNNDPVSSSHGCLVLVTRLSRPRHAAVSSSSRGCLVLVTRLSRPRHAAVSSSSRGCLVLVTRLSRPRHTAVSSSSHGCLVFVTRLSRLRHTAVSSSSHGCLVFVTRLSRPRHTAVSSVIFRRARLVVSAGGHLTSLQAPRLRRNIFQLTDLLERVSLVTLTALTCFN